MKTHIFRKKNLWTVLIAILIVCLMATILTALFSSENAAAKTTVWDGTTATAFESGTGSNINPYQISTAEQLDLLSKIVNGSVTELDGKKINAADYNNPDVYYELKNDIYLNDITNFGAWSEVYAPRNRFSPIGTLANPFSAQFAGKGKTIYGAYVYEEGEAGIFGVIRAVDVRSVQVRQVNIRSSLIISEKGEMGSVAARAENVVEIFECYAETRLISHASEDDIGVGGIVGAAVGDGITAPNIIKCVFDGALTASIVEASATNYKVLGGIVGRTYIPQSSYQDVYLSQCVNKGTIQNFHYEDRACSISAGGVLGKGYHGFTILDCGNEGSIDVGDCNGYVGGVIGNIQLMSEGSCERLWNTGDVVASSTSAGGILGGVYSNFPQNKLRFRDFYNEGNVLGYSSGSLIGAHTSANTNYMEFYNIVNFGAITSSAPRSLHGAIIGQLNSNITVVNFVNYDKESSMPNGNNYRLAGGYAAGAQFETNLGVMLAKSSGIFNDRTYTEQNSEIYFFDEGGTLHMSYHGSGVASKDVLVNLNGVSASKNISIWESAGKTLGKGSTVYSRYLPQPFKGKFASSEKEWKEGENAYDAFTGQGTQNDPYIIRSAQGLYTLRMLIDNNSYLGTSQTSAQMEKFNGSNVYYKLGADIYLNDVSNYNEWSESNTPVNNWNPIGSSTKKFKSNFDGNGYTIYGMYCSSIDSVGLFDTVEFSYLTNIKLEKSMINSQLSAGGIVSVMQNSTITNSKFQGKMFRKAMVSDSTIGMGGVAGYLYQSKAENCVADVEMTGGYSSFGAKNINCIGGIVGWSRESEIVSCSFSGNIDARYGNAGGIVGYMQQGKISECTSQGSVRSALRVGGLVGYASDVEKMSNLVGGESLCIDLEILANNNGPFHIGGIVGAVDSCMIVNCVFSGQINNPQITTTSSTPALYIGGIVGTLSSASANNISRQTQVINSRTTSSAFINHTFAVPSASGAPRQVAIGGIAGCTVDDRNYGVKIVNCINEAKLSDVRPVSVGIPPYSRGIVGIIFNGFLFNNVNISRDFEYGIIGIDIFARTIEAQNNYTAYGNYPFGNYSALYPSNIVTETITGNGFFREASGLLCNELGAEKTVRMEESKILCAWLDQVLNAYVAQTNIDPNASGALEYQLAYFNRKQDGLFRMEYTEQPMFYVRYNVTRPDNVLLEGGFFVSNMGKASNRTHILNQPVALAGFTMENWTYEENGAILNFDFDTPVARNYILTTKYSMDAPEIAPSSDIKQVYDGKTHEIRLNATVLHDLGDKVYIYSKTPNTAQSSLEDGIAFKDVTLEPNLDHQMSIMLYYKDTWGNVYNTRASHTFKVNITPAPLTITGFRAHNRVYDNTLDVTLSGGELSGIQTNDEGILDEVKIVSMPTVGTIFDKNVGEKKAVSFPEIIVEGKDRDNYNFILPKVTVDITPRTIALNGARAIGKTYDATTAVKLAVNGFNGILSVDDVSFDENNTVAFTADKNVGVAKPVTVSKVALSGKDAQNYICGTPTGLTVTITAKELNIVNLHPIYQSRVYDRTRKVELTGGYLNGVLSGDNVTCAMPTEGTVSTKNVGANKRVSVQAPMLSGADAANYTVQVSGEIYVDIVVKDVSIVNLKAVNRPYNKTSVVELTSDKVDGFIEGDDVSFSVPTSGTIGEIYVGINKPVSISWGTMQGIDATNYNIVLPELVTVDITPKPLSIEGITAVDREYDGTRDVALSAAGATLKGVEAGDNVSFTIPSFGTVGSANAGSRKQVTISGIRLISETQESILKNYTILEPTVFVDIQPRVLNVVWQEERSFVYNAKEQAPTAQAATDVNGEFAILDVSGAQTEAGENYTATAVLRSITGGKTENYVLAFDKVTFAVTPREVKVTVKQTVAYVDQTVFSNSVWNGNVKGLVAGHSFHGTVATVDFIVGRYESANDEFTYSDIEIRNAASLAVTSNYTIVYDLTVVIADGDILYSVNNFIGVYDGREHSIDLKISTANATVEYSTDGGESYSAQLPSFTNTGEYEIAFRISAANHTMVTASATVNISPAVLTVTLSADGGTYTGEPIGATSEVAGNYEEITVRLLYTGRSNGGVEYNSSDAPSAAGRYYVTASIDDPNYTLAHTSKSFTINRRETVIDVSGVETNYTYTAREQTVNTGATINHNETQPTYSGNVFTEVGSGKYTIVISAAQTDNYLAAETSVEISVARAQLSDASASYIAVYDGLYHGIDIAVTGLLGDDTIEDAIIEYSINQSDWQSDPVKIKNVSDSKTVYYRMTFANYLPLSGSKEITISVKELRIEGVSGGSQIYNNKTMVSQISGGNLIGAMTGDMVHPIVPRTGMMATADVGIDKEVTMDLITLSGADASNYTLVQPQVYVTVTPMSLSVQGLHIQEKAYDGTAEMTVDFKSAILFTPYGDDDVMIDSVTAVAEGTSAGEQKVNVTSIGLGGTKKDNYVVTLPTGLRGYIAARTLDIVWSADGGTYNGEPYAAAYAVSGYLEGEGANISLRYEGRTNGGYQFENESDAPYLAGEYTVTAVLDNGNYTLGENAKKRFVIARAATGIDIGQMQTQYTYNGKEQRIDSGATINHSETVLVYSNNSFTNVGSGRLTLTLTAAQTDNYEGAQKEVEITLLKAKYDLSSIRFDSLTTLASGIEHSLYIVGELPQGVSVEYVGNAQREVGVYIVRAVFTGDDENYQAISDMLATLTLRSATLTGSEGVEVSSEEGFDPNVALKVESKNSDAYTELYLDGRKLSVLTVKDIALSKNGQIETVDGQMKVKMLIEESLRERDDLMVIYIAPDGSVKNMDALREGDYMTFETDHNSVYAIVAFDSKALPIGAIIGIVLGILALIAIALLLLYLIRKRNNGNDHNGKTGNGSPDDPLIESKAEVGTLPAPDPDLTPAEGQFFIADNFVISENENQQNENAVVFVPVEQSLDAAFDALSREQKDFYERLRAYALEKEGITCNKTQTGETFKSGRKIMFKLSIKRNTTVALFSLEHPLLKMYKKQSGEDEGDAIKVKPTEVFVSGVAAFNAAKDMIDIVAKQLQTEKEEAAQKRKAARKSKPQSGDEKETK